MRRDLVSASIIIRELICYVLAVRVRHLPSMGIRSARSMFVTRLTRSEARSCTSLLVVRQVGFRKPMRHSMASFDRVEVIQDIARFPFPIVSYRRELDVR